MRRKLIALAAFAGVLLVASQAWAPPPPPRPAPRPAPPTPPRPTPPTTRPPTTRPPTTSPRPPVGSAKAPFHKSFEAARAKSAADAAHLLRTQGAFLARAERAAMLNLITFQMLRQKQAATLAELRRLRADWVAIGPGAGLDPLLALELEAVESAAERLLLAEVLKLIADGQFADADAKIAALESPRFLPVGVAKELPALRTELKRVTPFAKMNAAFQQSLGVETLLELFAALPAKTATHIESALHLWLKLNLAEDAMKTLGQQFNPAPVETLKRLLTDVEKSAGAEQVQKLRAELAASLFLLGRTKDANELLEGDVDPIHMATVLADLRAVVLGRGEVVTPQIANMLPREGSNRLPPVVAITPASELAAWKPPTLPKKPGKTRIATLTEDTRKRLGIALGAEVSSATTKINTAAERIRAALAAEAGPLKAFLDKLDAMRGKEPLTPAERQLASVAAARGLTVAETLGVLAAEVDRPASAVRVLATVPAFGNPGVFAVQVEFSGRAPDAFKAHADAGFKLLASSDRVRVREAVAAVLNTHAAKTVAGQMVEQLGCSALEAEVDKRLKLGETLPRAEYVQALLDVCRDWAEDYDRLSTAWRELNEIIAEVEADIANGGDDELQETLTLAKVRRLSVQNDRKRREAGINQACQLLGGYGPDAKLAAEWLLAQGEEKPWRAVALLNYARIIEGK